MSSSTNAGFRLSAQQERTWSQEGGEAPAFRAECEVLLEGPVDASRLRRAIDGVVARHEILRTVFQRQPGLKLPFQVIQEEASLTWELGEKQVLRLGLPVLCADRRTLRNLIAEIGLAYVGKAEPEDVLQYADIVEWQQELLTGEDTKVGRDYWRDAIRKLDVTSVLSAFEIAGEGEFAPEVVTRGLEAAVPVEVLLACWLALLSRLTGRSTVMAVCEFDGRKFQELEDALGLFAKFLPVQCDIQPGMPFSALAERVRSVLAELHGWQEIFDPGQMGPLPVQFEYAELPAAQQYGDLKFTVLRLEACAERFALKLSAGAKRLDFHFDASRLSRDTVERWAGHYQVLLAAALAHPETPIASLPLLSDDERQQFALWNQTAADYPRDRCLHELFEQQAVVTPDLPAVRCGEISLSYRELNERANRLAHHLRGFGVRPDSLVALCVERSVDMIAALLGILKAGGAFVPLNADNPKPRLAEQLAGAAALVTDSKLAALLPEFSGPSVFLDRFDWHSQNASNPLPLAQPDSLMYVIFTSGSTGVPKPVGIRHRNLVNYAWFIKNRLPGEHLHFATVSTLSADLGNTCIYPALLSGGCLHVIPLDVASDSSRFAAYQRQHPIDVLKIVPSHLSALLETEEGRGVLPRKHLVTGGESLTWPLVHRIGQLGATCEIWNHYGPTETTVGSLMLRLQDFSGPVIPIGRPIANTQVHILDSLRQPVPVGVTGELYIAGDGVTAGYLGQPELTTERFLNGMYRTGDLARFLPDGNVEFLGRADDQVKIRGYRIELGEIEAVLARHPSVRQAVVIARPDERGDKRLIGYVVSPHELEADQLRDYLKEQLPDYMVPSHLVTLAKLPLTANGKIDRQKLPEPEEAQARVYIAPRTETERAVAAIWREVFHRDRIGVEDNFFEIGGHSLLATQVISRVRGALRIDPPLRVLFESPTVAKLAKWIDEARGQEPTAQAPPMVRISRDRDLPLSFAQQRLWIVNQLDPHSALYNIPRGIRIVGKLNVEALRAALNEIVRRHESQRTTFTVRDGRPLQAIAPSLILSLPVHDVTGTDPEAAARDRAREEARLPFDLATGPLLRAQLLRLSAEDHVLLLTMHHIVSDAWSAGILMQELSALYQGTSLPELTIQYADYAAWQRTWFQGGELDRQLAYWREHLQGAPPVLDLPTDRPRSAANSFAGAAEVIRLSTETSAAIKRLSQQEDVTVFMTLLAGFQTLLYRYSGEEQIVLGTDVANRTATETEQLIGFFINLLALRGDLSGDPTFRELLGRTRESALGAYAHQDMPFDKLVEELQPERSAAHNPIVQALFVMENIPRLNRGVAGLEFRPFEMPITQSKFDLAVFVAEREEHFAAYWVYRTDLFERETILRMGRQFETLLRHAAAEPDTRLSALEIFTEEEKLQRGATTKRRKQLQHNRLMTIEPKTVSLSEWSDAE